MFFEGHCNTPQKTKTLTLRDHVKRIAIHCLLYIDMDLQNILQTNHVVSKPSQMCFGMSSEKHYVPIDYWVYSGGKLFFLHFSL